ncbi:MAG: hypothetical protein K2X35_20280 [Bryobacteraceae bacterium]|nr:hypothetical protein [Bryobacteraceae bacterium]
MPLQRRDFMRLACAAPAACFSGSLSAQTRPPASDRRTGRLAAVARLWNAVKYFHPYLAYRPTDWDAALLRAIPAIEGSASARDYEAAVARMLAELNDSQTRTGGDFPPPAPGKARLRFHSGYAAQRGAGSPRYYSRFEAAETLEFHRMELGEGVWAVVRVSEPAAPDAPEWNPDFTRDRRYDDSPYPDREKRILAWFRLWGVLRYFYPYHSLLGAYWDGALPSLLGRFEDAKDSVQYGLAVLEAVKPLNDTQVAVFHPGVESYLGTFAPGLDLKWIEGQTVVTHVFDRRSGVELGDAILAVDGEDVWARRERLGRLLSASTPQALNLRVTQALLGGAFESDARIAFRNAEGLRRELTLKRTFRATRALRRNAMAYVDENLNLGYLDLVRLRPDQLAGAYRLVAECRGILLDLRGNPQPNSWLIASRFTRSHGTAALVDRPEWRHPARGSQRTFDQTFGPSSEGRFPGKVVALMNEETFGLGEHTCLYLEAAEDVTFIGSPTNGTDGDPTNLVLPGGVTVVFSGQGIRHGDGRRLQGVGLTPHVAASPTIAGIRAGRDEVLEQAIEWLKRYQAV